MKLPSNYQIFAGKIKKKIKKAPKLHTGINFDNKDATMQDYVVTTIYNKHIGVLYIGPLTI